MAERKPESACVLFSGGVDSTALLCDALRRYERVQPVYVRAGLRWEAAELAAARRILGKLGNPRLEKLAVLSCDMSGIYWAHWSIGGKVPSGRSDDDAVYLPGRNVAILGLAGTFASVRGIPVIEIGLLKTNPFPDGSPRFLASVNAAFGRAFRPPVKVRAPLIRMKKAQAASLLTPDLLDMTFSCLAPRGSKACRDCNKCAERKKALA